MFDKHTKWTDSSCWYVVALKGFRRAWIAGPYELHAEAEAVLHRATAWALTRSGDPEAKNYAYRVTQHHHGHYNSILGSIDAKRNNPGV